MNMKLVLGLVVALLSCRGESLLVPSGGGGTGGPGAPATCAAGQTRCGDACVDPQSDPRFCGGCGQSCAAGQRCAGGAVCQ